MPRCPVEAHHASEREAEKVVRRRSAPRAEPLPRVLDHGFDRQQAALSVEPPAAGRIELDDFRIGHYRAALRGEMPPMARLARPSAEKDPPAHAEQAPTAPYRKTSD